MFVNQLGIQLILWLGKTVPLPASPFLLDALVNVQVTNDDEGGDGFQMTFAMDNSLGVEYDLLLSGSLDPFNRVIIGALVGGMPEVLIDGIITHHQVNPGSETGIPTLTVTGKDVSVMMDLEEVNKRYPNQPDSVIALQIIAAYAQYGLVPTVAPTTDVPIELERIPRQYETDFQFLKRMAERNGYVFYVEPITFGVNKAYWGPVVRAGIPQSALTTNMGPATNVESLSFSQDPLAPVGTEGTIVEPILGLTLPIPSLPSLRVPPLALSPTQPKRTKLFRDTAKKNPATAAVTAVAAATNTPDAVQGTGTLQSSKYGKVLRARGLVGVRGSGFSYDGFYYVRNVTHTISRGEYTQSFTISREGTGPLSPVVVP